ncbi:hypothetical protein Ancab_017986 [Ancistrocladus abbreviatus]
MVVLWSIHDHISSTASDQLTNKPRGSGSIIKQNGDSPSIGPCGIFQGHEDTVEDVQFCPKSLQEFCSVGDDSCLVLWDARSGSSPVVKVEKAHSADLHCVDWNPFDENYILTGSADGSVGMFECWNLTSGGFGSPWSPHNPTIFGSAAEDGFLNICDYEKGLKLNLTTCFSPSDGKESRQGPVMLLVGLHVMRLFISERDKVVDFHWNAPDPLGLLLSVSDDSESSGGGGTLQVNGEREIIVKFSSSQSPECMGSCIWLMSDLVYRPEEEVLAELEQFKSHVVTCASKS